MVHVRVSRGKSYALHAPNFPPTIFGRFLLANISIYSMLAELTYGNNSTINP